MSTLSHAEIARYSRHLLLPEVGLEGQERALTYVQVLNGAPVGQRCTGDPERDLHIDRILLARGMS